VNKGLGKAISLLLPFKMKYPSISWADLIQMAGTRAVKACGGPSIPIRYGRVDLPKEFFADEKENSEFCLAQSKKLPCNSFPYPDGSHTPEFHIRNVFFRLGFSSREIVALCGGHTIGRGFKDRTGVCPFSSGETQWRMECSQLVLEGFEFVKEREE
jgi:L-ascorbate peroxidase